MTIGEWLGIGSLIITNAGAVYLTYNNFSQKISRIYARFDEYKKQVEQKIDKEFVRKDLCKVLENNQAANLEGVEKRLTDSFDKLEKKVDENFKVVIDLMRKP